MATYKGIEGVWVLWSYGDDDRTRVAHQFSSDPVEIIEDLGNAGYGYICFWPVGQNINGAIDEWPELRNREYDEELIIESLYRDAMKHFVEASDIRSYPQTPILTNVRRSGDDASEINLPHGGALDES